MLRQFSTRPAACGVGKNGSDSRKYHEVPILANLGVLTETLEIWCRSYLCTYISYNVRIYIYIIYIYTQQYTCTHIHIYIYITNIYIYAFHLSHC